MIAISAHAADFSSSSIHGLLISYCLHSKGKKDVMFYLLGQATEKEGLNKARAQNHSRISLGKKILHELAFAATNVFKLGPHFFALMQGTWI